MGTGRLTSIGRLTGVAEVDCREREKPQVADIPRPRRAVRLKKTVQVHKIVRSRWDRPQMDQKALSSFSIACCAWKQTASKLGEF